MDDQAAQSTSDVNPLSSSPDESKTMINPTSSGPKGSSSKMIWISIAIVILLVLLGTTLFLVMGKRTTAQPDQSTTSVKQNPVTSPSPRAATESANSEFSSGNANTDLDKDLKALDGHLTQVSADQVNLNTDQGTDAPENL